jgi:DNA-binding response OmpR family regulator
MGKKILVIEELDILRIFLAAALTRKGYEVEVAFNSHFALIKLATEQFDLAMVDADVLKERRNLVSEIQKIQAAIPILLLLNPGDDVPDQPYLIKPVSNNDLFDKVAKLLEA